MARRRWTSGSLESVTVALDAAPSKVLADLSALTLEWSVYYGDRFGKLFARDVDSDARQ
jgi:hypothetical protein